MTKQSFKSRFKRWLLHYGNQSAGSGAQRNRGFTLLELLVVTLIAGGLVSGLMYVAVELMGIDQRESSLSETQREMQLALDYISSELREAVYVYPGEYFTASRGNANDPASNFRPDLRTHLPAAISNNSSPVIAFWKQQPLPNSMRAACAAPQAPLPVTNLAAPISVPCIAGSAYTLVVYSLSWDNPGGIWNGRARLTRYALTQFNEGATAANAQNAGYVNPSANRNFETWPWGILPGTTNTGNLQTVYGGLPTGNPVVLVDFVDNGAGERLSNVNFNVNTSPCPADYTVSPPNPISINGQPTRSFYACISNGLTTGENREVLLFLRGNANGRPGISNDARFLPTLETRVLTRGVLGKSPGS